MDADPTMTFVASLRRGERAATRRLFELCLEPALGRATRLLGSPGDAHDVVIGVLVEFLDRYVQAFRGASEREVLTYVLVATVERCGRFRRAHARLAARAADEAAVRQGAGATSALDDPWLRARLEACLQTLPEATRQVIRLKYGLGKDNPEIAALLGVSRAAVSQRLTDPKRGALGRLRKCLATAARQGSGSP